MKPSILKKLFIITSAVMIICTTVVSLILVLFLRNMWIDDKNKLLKNNVMLISDSTDEIFSTPLYMDSLNTLISVISKTAGADIYVVDSKGNYVTCANHYENCVHQGKTVSDNILKKTFKGSYDTIGKLGGIYEEKCYTVGGILEYKGKTIGYVYASVPSSSLKESIQKMLNVMILANCSVFIISLIVVFIITARITKPLRLMTKAAEQMARGDFLQQIPVTHRDEIGQLSEAFNKMTKSLASLESMRRNFISSISHELKTPMTTISGFVDGILDGTISPDDEKKYLSVVSDETKRLSRLVNSMLQMSRLESDENKLNLSTFNFTDIIARTLISFEPRIVEKNLQISGMDGVADIYLSADEDMIYQVVYNLTENAIKFTPYGGTITLKPKIIENVGVSFTIRNSGEGLSECELAGIFERFYKTDRSRNMDKSGVGFGLHIVKTIVRKHCGEIIASSTPGEYTQLEVKIPNQNIKENSDERI